ncbi:MAG: 1,4-dihydroxy-6-naphthoate synthase [Nannocystaceae bacterium]|nr:1,4-dihydroxy-6-naphthoate synthase [Nannocystaceae bacterium]
MLRLGYSPCPNDTFMFHALVHGHVPDAPEVDVVLDDIEGLNRRVLEPGGDALALSKLSVSAWARVRDRYAVLDAGAALGRGCGPLVVGRQRAALSELAGKKVAVPGLGTTAYALLRMFGPQHEPVPMRFDEVMPAVARGDVDAGLIIHESRFTYPVHGLVQLADLGELWEADTGLPLPLGVIVAQRSLDEGVRVRFEAALSASVRYAWANPEASGDYVQAHSQEMAREVCNQHIGLYVNAFSAQLGDEGRAAIDTFVRRGTEAGVL